ncbi:gamma-aminobutyric acid receptor subunit beta-1-like [Montipora capricornis]|uniref:gamma-aminobutyric acid receptor subunit beta-1-like n=1 Tax=Montipora capricornis TaxID=246305 RepID=UPI0035F138AD
MAKYWMGIFTLFTLFAPNIAQCETGLPARQSNRATNSSMKLAEYLSTEYDNAVRPNCGSGKPTEVFVDIYVESFGNIMEMNMEFPLYMYFRQMWVDDRIAKSVKSNVLLRRELVTLLWFPDPFCYNARKSDLMLPDTDVDSVVRIEPNGFVFYSRSAHILASCELDLHDFPMDTQLCEITFGSYGHNDSDILMKWKNPTIEIGNREMAQFSVGDAVLSTKVNSFTSGNFTALTVTFPFKRRMGYYVIQVYIPCIFLVMLSWIVFWMRPDDSASRLTVGITTILTIVFLLGYTNGMLPKVSYVKGLDWYLMVSFTIIFLSLLECIVVDRLWRASNTNKSQKQKDIECNTNRSKTSKRSKDNKDCSKCRYVTGFQILRPKKTDTSTQTACIEDGARNQWDSNNQAQEGVLNLINDEFNPLSLDQIQRPRSSDDGNESDIEHEHYDTVVRCFVRRNPCPVEMSARVDKASRILFPLTFFLYNVAYWLFYYHGITIFPRTLQKGQ